jgi:two-component system, OmpR family, sensor histidine kinase ChvG
MKLKTQLVALSLLTLLLPWSGWKLLQELERYLRDAQESSLLGAARLAAASLPLEFQTRLSFLPDRYARLRALPRAPSLDGHADDWPAAEQGLEFRSADGALAVSLLAGAHGGRLFLLFDVRGGSAGATVGAARTAAEADGVTLLTRNPRGLQRFHVSPGAPGPLQLRSQAGAVGQGEGFWLDTPSGYRLELSLPDGGADTSISFLAVAAAGPRLAGPLAEGDARDAAAAAAAQPARGQWIALAPEWERLSAWLARATGEATRAWLVDAEAWVLADSRSESTLGYGAGAAADGSARAAPLETTWLQRSLYRLVAGSRTGLRDEWPVVPLRLLDPAVDRALAGGEGVSWSQEIDTAVVRNTAAVPVVLDGEVAGAIVVQSSSEGLLLVTNRALGRLLFTTLALALGLAAGLWYFASRLSRRVRRLSSAVSRAMEDRVDPESLPLRRDRDELGELARNNEKLLRAVADYSQYLQTLAGKLSHELKTPLAITRSSLDNLSSQQLDDESRRFVERAQEGVERQAAIVRAMSEASRLEAAIGAADWERVDLAELVGRCAAGYRTLYQGRKLSLQLPPGPVQLNCAPDLLAQALDKLVDNAFSLTGPDDEVAISLQRSAGGCELVVRNTGSALPDDLKERLFDSLVSVRARRGAEPHLGLGLYIVRLVVAAHGGEVSARNLPGGAGVEFLIRLRAP